MSTLIFGMQRTGSTVVKRLVNRYYQLHGLESLISLEFFNLSHEIIVRRSNGKLDIRETPITSFPEEVQQKRRNRPKNEVMDLYQERKQLFLELKDRLHVMKLQSIQIQCDQLIDLMESHFDDIFVLYRSKIIEQFISICIGRKTGIWAVEGNKSNKLIKTIKKSRFRCDPLDFQKFYQMYTTAYDNAKKLDKSKVNMLVDYDEWCGKPEKEIMEYLGYEYNDKIGPIHLKKLSSGDDKKRIVENYDEVVEWFENTDFPNFKNLF